MMGRWRVWVTVGGVLLALVATPVYAQDDEVETESSPHTLGYQSLFTGRLNPMGLIEALSLFYQYRLYESDSPVFETNFVGPVGGVAVSPAFTRISGGVELQPLSVLKLYAVYDWFAYFGTFDVMQSFASADAEFDEDTLEALDDGYSATGSQLTLGGLVQLKVGPIAVRSNFRAVRSDFNLRAGEPVYYDLVYDVLVPNEDWLFTNDADLLFMTDFGLVAGLRHTVTWADFDADDFAADFVGEDPNTQNQRLGLLAAYTIFDHVEPSRFDKPTVFLVTGWYLDHRYRAGATSSQAFPYMVIGFAFSGDLL